MIGLREDFRAMAHGDYKMEKEFKLNFFFSFSFYHTKVYVLIFTLAHQSLSLFILL